jgi:curli biogenesis system outer membrane secretion channel CsgG
MNLRALVIALSIVAISGCRQRTVEEAPVTDVNQPRPKRLAEPTGTVAVPLTNVPHTSAPTDK